MHAFMVSQPQSQRTNARVYCVYVFLIILVILYVSIHKKIFKSKKLQMICKNIYHFCIHNICIFSIFDRHYGQYCWFSRTHKNLTKASARTLLDTLYYNLNMFNFGRIFRRIWLTTFFVWWIFRIARKRVVYFRQVRLAF